MRFAFVTNLPSKLKDGSDKIVLGIRLPDAKSLAAPELALSWIRNGQNDWSADMASAACPMAGLTGAARVFQRFARFVESMEVDLDDPDAVMVAIEREKGFQIVFDPRVKKMVRVESLKESEGGFQYVARAAEETLASCVAKDEDDARSTLVRAVQTLMFDEKTKPETVDSCAAWLKAGRKVTKTGVSGNAPQPHPVEAYLRRGQTGHKRLEAKKEKA